MSIIPFNHVMAAHCESGTLTALLNHHGLKISEPMVFGISSGIFFGYMKTPMLAFPSVITRIRPGHIRKNFAKRTGIKFVTKKFRNPDKAEKELDKLLEQNQPVAVQVDFFYLDYFPSWYRIHINVHFLTIIGKKGDNYIVSDCYHPQIAEISRSALRKGRFARGSMAPHGFMYYPVNVPHQLDFNKEVIKGIKNTAFNMLKIPLPFLGVKGIRRFADKIVEWPKYARDTEQLAHEIFKINILLEDQGTGGAGFRYIYASFLREAASILNKPELITLSKRLLDIGDGWREISLFAARMAKNRDLNNGRLREMGDMIREKADLEEVFFKELKQIIA
ncbi:MAG: BtrH N-terminal domain-containing protein [Bacteroidales bacterium]|nr:BtrH N-terminal domain-containing protein [Bacteroidales bacterium]MBN2762082.1 BtrH N-terminal domain-containing protein [Bacteroidales bacterium]